MEKAVLPRALGACLIILACFATGALCQPKPVPRLVDQPLDQASYVTLAREWQDYIDKHGETADALVNLGMAQNYSGAHDAARLAGKRAVELEPDNPRALNFYAGLLSTSEEGLAEALRLLERCRSVAPDYGNALATLAATHLKSGQLQKAADVSKTIFDRRIMSRPLMDYAYNMLIGLPKGAVLVVNGDNDTFSPLALQAGMDLRTDVIVVNRHLLNMPVYYDSLLREHAVLRPAGMWKPEASLNASRSIIERWITEKKVPLYISSTVDMNNLGLDPKTMNIEGLSLRASGKGLTPEEAARLVLERYRLDSATDWDFAWDLAPDVSTVLYNYVACLAQLSQLDGVPDDLKCKLLGKAAAIAKFHDLSTRAHVEILLKKCEKE